MRAIDWEVLRSNGAGGCSNKEFKRASRNGTTKYWLDRTHRAMFTKFESPAADRRGLKRSRSGAYALKTLWERDPTTAARSVLSGGWRDKTDKTLPNVTVATHWGNLLSKKGTADKLQVQHVDTLWCLTNPVTPDEVKATLVEVSGVSSGVRWASLKSIAKETLSSLFNVWMLAGKYLVLSPRALLP